MKGRERRRGGGQRGCRDKEEGATDEETEVGTGFVFIAPHWMLPNNIFH